MWNSRESKTREAVASSDRDSNGILRGGVPRRRFTKVSRRSATTGSIAVVTRLVLCRIRRGHAADVRCLSHRI